MPVGIGPAVESRLEDSIARSADPSVHTLCRACRVAHDSTAPMLAMCPDAATVLSRLPHTPCEPFGVHDGHRQYRRGAWRVARVGCTHDCSSTCARWPVLRVTDSHWHDLTVISICRKGPHRACSTDSFTSRRGAGRTLLTAFGERPGKAPVGGSASTEGQPRSKAATYTCT